MSDKLITITIPDFVRLVKGETLTRQGRDIHFKNMNFTDMRKIITNLEIQSNLEKAGKEK